MKNCRVEGCERPVKSRDLCGAHYKRLWRHGDPKGGALPKGLAQNFVDQEIPAHEGDECLIWPYGKTRAGYGVFMRDGTQYAHHVACAISCGPRPSDRLAYAAHSCGTPACVNPRHLRWATPTENSLDRRLHGTHNDGENNAHCRLTDADVAEIIQARPTTTCRALAMRYGVSVSRISAIVNGRARRRLTGRY